MQPGIEYKGMPAESGTTYGIKDIDESKGRVLGYFSIFGNVDSDGDIMLPGAFKKSLGESNRRIKHLYQHDPFRPLAGTAKGNLIVTEDKNGLIFDSTISQTTWGRDTIRLYMDGVIDEHSVGFNTVRDNKAGRHREIIEAKLWEGSTVTWGANALAGTTAIKSMTKETLFSKMGAVMKSIRNGKYENEEIFDQLELYFKQLENLIMDLEQKAQAPTSEEPIQNRDWSELKSILTL